jgi:hypothetical protein
MHLRAPSTDHGRVSFYWALGFTVYIWAFMLAVGVSNAMSVLVALASGFVIFLFVRAYGEDRPRRRRTAARGRG